MNELLRTEDLTKVFRGFTAVDNVSLRLERGAIYGLIGKNGAGKTTILRMIAGFANPSSGGIVTDGGRKLRIGALIEEPGLYPNMTALQNMEVKRLALGLPESGLANELLTFVGLSRWADTKTRAYSFGMKQRLGIALALMGDPELLILDEPTNGLDPEGIAEFRKMMFYLRDVKGMTIIISSHQLAELSKIVTFCGILQNGRLIREDSIENIRKNMLSSLKITGVPGEKVREVLNEMEIYGYKRQNENTVLLMEAMDRRDEILKRLIENGVSVTECTPIYDSLEEYFLGATGGYSYDKHSAF